jgi:hypothetical protein
MRCLAVALLAAACSRPAPLATLTEKQGAVERDTAAQLGAWLPAELGASFGLGDGVVTRADASARLALDDGTVLGLGAETLVRFSSTAPPAHAHAFDVETGAATLQAGDEPIDLRMRIGLARIERGSTVVLTPSGPRLRFEVRVGRAMFGASDALGAGDGVLVDASGAIEAEPSDSSRDALARANLELADPTGAITAVVRGRGGSVMTRAGWAPLGEGAAQLAAGSELTTAAGTSIEIERDGQHAVLGQNGRYLIGPRDGVLVNATRGRVLAGGDRAVRIEVPGGVILIAAEGRASIDVGARRTLLGAEALDAVIETGERRQTVAAGHAASLGPGGELRLDAVEPGASEDDRNDALSFADVDLPSGVSATIHDPVPPSAVRFTFGDACPGGGRVLLTHGGRSLRRGLGADSVALSIPPGSHRYELRCEGERRPARSGQLTVLADAATRSIASKPPSSALVADGRKYTVLYQNRLPVVSLSWPNAPATAALRLAHEFGGKSETLSLAQPRREFASGELMEGHHVFFFEGGGQVSRQTTVDIVFDNAAPRASLSLPPVLDAKPGERVLVAGTALPGSQVWIEGERAPLDAGGRFSATVMLPLERHALVLRLAQPGRSTHYYLRRGQSQ